MGKDFSPGSVIEITRKQTPPNDGSWPQPSTNDTILTPIDLSRQPVRRKAIVQSPPVVNDCS